MQTINISEARKRLPELIDKAYKSSETFEITKGGIPMAKITKIGKNKTKKTKKMNVKKAIKTASKLKWIWDSPEWKNKSTVEIADYLRERSQRRYVR